MKVLRGTSEFTKVKPRCVLTIGNFDGVHLGHQAILTAARQTAEDRAADLTVMTFEPHPLAILYPGSAPGILTSLEMKKLLLAESEVHCLIVVESTAELLALSPADFVQRFCVENIRPGLVVEGESFNFGSNRAGNIDTLRALGVAKGFDVSVVESQQAKLSTGQAVRISSTAIRDLLETGNVADAAIALGRPYRLIGQIVPGRGKGKQLGFPTANMQPPAQLVPAAGVYAGLVGVAHTEEQVCKRPAKLPAAFSIGRAETLTPDRPLLIEAHILTGQVGHLHGKWLAMDFVQRIRNQQKFKTETELTAQITKDCKTANQILAKRD